MPAVRAVPRRLEGLQVVQDSAHRPLVQGLADHDGGPARPRREHRPNLGGPDVLVAQGLRLLNHVHHLVHVFKCAERQREGVGERGRSRWGRQTSAKKKTAGERVCWECPIVV